jgi:DNA-binding NtrC family response regulator
MRGIDRPTVLAVDDEPAVLDALDELLGDAYELRRAGNAAGALHALSTAPADCILLDLRLPDMDGLSLLRRIRAGGDRTPVVVISAVQSLDAAVDAGRLGVRRYVAKPWDPIALRDAVAEAVAPEPKAERGAPPVSPGSRTDVVRFEDIVAVAPAMLEAVGRAWRAAGAAAPVLLLGDTGTGKDLLARAIHHAGPRAAGPFVAVNCAAVPEPLAESEFFGHEKGAFTGADRPHRGAFEQAHGGTLFLNEIASLPLPLQAKLLDALQQNRIRRVGGEGEIPVDVRLLAATNVDLRAAVAAGRFRPDLFYRLDALTIVLPPLRERPEDIPALARRFLEEWNRAAARPLRGFTDACLRRLVRRRWPGNVRELKNTVECLAVLEDGHEIGTRHLPPPPAQDGPDGPEGGTMRETAMKFERGEVLKALVETGWNRTRAAKRLGFSRNTLLAKMRKHKLTPPDRDSNSRRRSP